MSEEWPRCSRCGIEFPRGLITYTVSVAPGVQGWNVRANENPVKFRKAGMCKGCAVKIADFIKGAG